GRGGRVRADRMLRVRPADDSTTGPPGGTRGGRRAAASTHKAGRGCNRQWFYHDPPVEPGDKCLHVGPISHGSGYLFVPIWLLGGCNVMVDKFEPPAVVDLMEREGIAYMFAVPTMLNPLNPHPTVPPPHLSNPPCLP